MHACSDEIIQPIKVTTLGRITFHVMTFSKGWVPGTETPKIQTLPEWGGGSDPCPCLFNIFTLKNDLRTFVEKCRESHLRDIMGQIA